MATLLRLPREIRDFILELVLLSPLYIDQAATRKVITNAELLRAEWPRFLYPLFTNRIHYLTCDVFKGPSALALHLTSRQLYQETSDYLARYTLHHQLHVAIIDWTWLWPTWRYIPLMKATPFDLFEISISSCSCFGSADEDIDSMQQSVARAFTTLIEQILLVGAKGACFRTLRIDLTTKPSTAPNQPLSLLDVPGRTVEGMKHLTFEPLYACNQEPVEAFASSLDHLIYSILVSHGESIEQGRFYTRKVEKIEFAIDGVMRTTWGDEFLV
jgi:hypothetical protein